MKISGLARSISIPKDLVFQKSKNAKSCFGILPSLISVRSCASGKAGTDVDPLIVKRAKEILETIDCFGARKYFNGEGLYCNKVKFSKEIRILDAATPVGPCNHDDFWSEKNRFRLLEAFRTYKGDVYEVQQKEFPDLKLTMVLDQLTVLGRAIKKIETGEKRYILSGYKKFGCDWDQISDFVGTKSPIICCTLCVLSDSAFNYDNIKYDQKWLTSDTEKLADIIDEHGDKDWDLISKKFGEKFSLYQIKYFYENVTLARAPVPWKKKEIKMLLRIKSRKRFLTRKQLQQEFFPKRTPKDVHDKWEEINPFAKNCEWTEGEIESLITLAREHESKWDVVAWHLRSRTSHECQKRWFAIQNPEAESQHIDKESS